MSMKKQICFDMIPSTSTCLLCVDSKVQILFKELHLKLQRENILKIRHIWKLGEGLRIIIFWKF